jgi:hypothetical protein
MGTSIGKQMFGVLTGTGKKKQDREYTISYQCPDFLV